MVSNTQKLIAKLSEFNYIFTENELKDVSLFEIIVFI